MSRPVEYTTEAIITALKETNGLVSLAARRLGCDTYTIYSRAKKVQAVQKAIDESRIELVDLAEAKLRGAVLDGEAWAVSMVLKTLGKSRGYVERQEVTGSDGAPVKAYINVSPDDWDTPSTTPAA